MKIIKYLRSKILLFIALIVILCSTALIYKGMRDSFEKTLGGFAKEIYMFFRGDKPLTIEINKISQKRDNKIKCNHVFIYYNDLYGLRTGDKVRYQGRLVGYAEIFCVNPEEDKRYEVLVVFKDPKLKMKKNSQFYINTSGINNDKYIEIVSSPDETEYIEKGSYVMGGKSLEHLMLSQNIGKYTLGSKEDIIKYIDEALVKTMLDKTIVISIPDEDGYIFAEPWERFSKGGKEYKKIDMNNMENILKQIYKDRNYSYVLIKAGKNVRYEYLYNVIDSFEDILKKNKLLRCEEYDMPRYLFSKPY